MKHNKQKGKMEAFVMTFGRWATPEAETLTDRIKVHPSGFGFVLLLQQHL